MDEKTARARELRRQQTRAESLLWAQLRDRRLGGYKFRRQRPVGRFYADFACVEEGIIVELDGSGHDYTFDRDASRDRQLGRAGYRVLRIPNDEVERNLGGVLQTILVFIEGEQPDPPSPYPSPASGRGDSI